ncbi:unnamed protein product [Haemonchus placei]|uniref:Secreted protein n=1 Tax=Haemonchus placei TaxID=6290 RepID=A0A0N4WJC3_HAEPC|nr:unnamed protein product [Haemonchus placei]
MAASPSRMSITISFQLLSTIATLLSRPDPDSVIVIVAVPPCPTVLSTASHLHPNIRSLLSPNQRSRHGLNEEAV